VGCLQGGKIGPNERLCEIVWHDNMCFGMDYLIDGEMISYLSLAQSLSLSPGGSIFGFLVLPKLEYRDCVKRSGCFYFCAPVQLLGTSSSSSLATAAPVR